MEISLFQFSLQKILYIYNLLNVKRPLYHISFVYQLQICKFMHICFSLHLVVSVFRDSSLFEKNIKSANFFLECMSIAICGIVFKSGPLVSFLLVHYQWCCNTYSLKYITCYEMFLTFRVHLKCKSTNSKLTKKALKLKFGMKREKIIRIFHSCLFRFHNKPRYKPQP